MQAARQRHDLGRVGHPHRLNGRLAQVALDNADGGLVVIHHQDFGLVGQRQRQ